MAKRSELAVGQQWSYRVANYYTPGEDATRVTILDVEPSKYRASLVLVKFPSKKWLGNNYSESHWVMLGSLREPWLQYLTAREQYLADQREQAERREEMRQEAERCYQEEWLPAFKQFQKNISERTGQYVSEWDIRKTLNVKSLNVINEALSKQSV